MCCESLRGGAVEQLDGFSKTIHDGGRYRQRVDCGCFEIPCQLYERDRLNLFVDARRGQVEIGRPVAVVALLELAPATAWARVVSTCPSARPVGCDHV